MNASKKTRIILMIITIVLALLINFLLFLPFFIEICQPEQTSFIIDLEKERTKDTDKDTDEEELMQYILSSGITQPPANQEIQDDASTTDSTDTTPQNTPITPSSHTLSTTPEHIPDTTTEEIDASDSTIVEQEPENQDESKQLHSATTLTTGMYKEPSEPPIEKKPKKRRYKKIVPQAPYSYSKQVPLCSAPPEVMRSLAQIAAGFMKSTQQEAGHNAPPKTTTSDQLIAHQYGSKIWNLIKNCFRVNDNKLYLPQSVDTKAYLVVTIKKSGELIDIHLESNNYSDSLKQIEQLIVKHARSAGLFPPLPSIFTKEQKTFTFPLHVNGQAGCHSYQMSYNS